MPHQIVELETFLVSRSDLAMLIQPDLMKESFGYMQDKNENREEKEFTRYFSTRRINESMIQHKAICAHFIRPHQWITARIDARIGLHCTLPWFAKTHLQHMEMHVIKPYLKVDYYTTVFGLHVRLKNDAMIR